MHGENDMKLLNHCMIFTAYVIYNAPTARIMHPGGPRVGYPYSREFFLFEELRSSHKKTKDIALISVFRSFITRSSV
jgi:hypothetical protein